VLQDVEGGPGEVEADYVHAHLRHGLVQGAPLPVVLDPHLARVGAVADAQRGVQDAPDPEAERRARILPEAAHLRDRPEEHVEQAEATSEDRTNANECKVSTPLGALPPFLNLSTSRSDRAARPIAARSSRAAQGGVAMRPRPV